MDSLIEYRDKISEKIPPGKRDFTVYKEILRDSLYFKKKKLKMNFKLNLLNLIKKKLRIYSIIIKKNIIKENSIVKYKIMRKQN